MTALALVHTTLGVVALASGAVVLARRKGDRLHRRAGWTYAGSMFGLCLLSFGLRDSTPFVQGLGPFHVAALVSLVTLSLGVWAVVRKPKDWLQHHYMWMAWSYIGLVMATGGHVVQPIFVGLAGAGVPRGAALAAALGVAWALPPLLGSRWIKVRQGGWDSLRPAPPVG